MKNPQIHEDLRLEEISNLLIQYSLGNFDEQLPMTGEGDGIDAIIAGVNMLGEEMKHVTVSRDSLSRIYNSIAEILIVADLNGNIEDVNGAATKYLNKKKFDLLNKSIFDFIKINRTTPAQVQESLQQENKDKIVVDGALLSNNSIKLKCTFSVLKDVNGNVAGILLIAEDITDKLAMEKRVIRAIIDTQEKERNRFATDLHDSLGQQLSGIRFYISALQGAVEPSKYIEEQFSKTLKSIDNAASELRSICFNLMPRTLENHTLQFSLQELASKFSVSELLKLSVSFETDVPKFSKEFEIACFRIVQEFLNNAMKHGKATEVSAHFSVVKNSEELVVILSDNGVGFDVNLLAENTGMGIRNINTRVESYYGKVKLMSSPGMGIKMRMTFPLAFITLQ